ncbi:MAG: LysM peptidoglycan-binding domain-containing protein [Lentisphaerae bacterium]|nr:LysM peptidoglycan-binding domain-containing protein [Lentisphaerota bacterium]
MGYERNRFRSVGPGAHILGTVVEYDANHRWRNQPSGWRLAVYAVVLVAVLISFISARGCFSPKPSSKAKGDAAVAKAATASDGIRQAKHKKTSQTSPAKIQVPSQAARQASSWAENASGRSARERTLLLRLADAERQGRLAIAVDTIEQLRARPSMADIDDKLARRLGTLNVKRLFSGEAVPWVVDVTVRRGQSVHRIAKEHGTTVAAVRQLNGLSPAEEPKAGRTLRVLEFPRATFVVHKQTRHADLTLNGKLFKRYYVSVGKNTVPGAYPITSAPNEGPRSRFAALGIRVAPTDMRELDMFLAPGSSLTVSEM